SKEYAKRLAAEKLVVNVVPVGSSRSFDVPVGAHGVEVRFPIDASKAPLYEKALLGSVSQGRATIADQTFDGLKDIMAHGLGRPSRLEDESLVAYTILALAPGNHVDVRTDLHVDAKDTGLFGQIKEERFRRSDFKNLNAASDGADTKLLGGG